jgi:hypothetical protein
MKYLFSILIFCIFLCVSCVATVGPQGTIVSIAPPLPMVVELGAPYYVYGGYYYHHVNNQWYYSRSKEGRWRELPRDRYPKEVKYKGKYHKKDWKR